MNSVVIAGDSTSDLTKELLTKHNIPIIPLYVNFKDEALKDTVDITTEGLYKKVEELGSLPKTAAPSVGDFIEFFKPMIDDGKDIVYIGISSKLSATLQNAVIAAGEFPEGRI